MIPVDAHVHFHNLRRVPATLNCAARNFRRLAADWPAKQARVHPLSERRFVARDQIDDANPSAAAAGQRAAGPARPASAAYAPAQSQDEDGITTDDAVGILLLVQSAREHVFEQLPTHGTLGGWRFDSVEHEPQTCVATDGKSRIVIVCGQQICAHRGLEVLALGTRARFDERRTLAATIESVIAAGALPVLPWGFGKWQGRRGVEVKELLASADPGTLFLGDNGGRLAAVPLHRLLREGAERGFRVLPGTDAFPFSSDMYRVGSYGFLANTRLSNAAPWQDLASWLHRTKQDPVRYGDALGIARFAINQVRIHVHNRVARRFQEGRSTTATTPQPATLAAASDHDITASPPALRESAAAPAPPPHSPRPMALTSDDGKEER